MRSTPQFLQWRATAAWRKSRRPGSVSRSTCPRQFQNRSSSIVGEPAPGHPARSGAAMQPQVIVHSLAYLTQAAAMTLYVSLAGIILGGAIGFAVCIARLSGNPVLVRAGAFYVSFFRGVPLLVQLLVIYYFLAEFG